MKVLNFNIVGQTITRDPLCDFSGLVAGSRGYLHARFHFSADWAGCKKVAIFSGNGAPYPVPLTHNTCEIPAEALLGAAVQVRVIGRRPGFEISTGTVAFPQKINT
jgi:hypothetical protein